MIQLDKGLDNFKRRVMTSDGKNQGNSEDYINSDRWAFRKAEAADVQSLLGLLVLCYGALEPPLLLDMRSSIASTLGNAGHIYGSGASIWLAENNEGVIDGCFFLDYPNPDLGVIQFFLIRPDLYATFLPKKLAYFATLKAQELGGREVGFWHNPSFKNTAFIFEEFEYKLTGAQRQLGDFAQTEEIYYLRSLWYQPNRL